MSLSAPKHPIDDISVADGLRIHEITGQSVENIRYILRYPRMHALSTLLRVMTSLEIQEAIASGAVGDVEGEADDNAEDTVSDLVEILRDSNYQVSRLNDKETPTPDEVRDYALERIEAEMKATNATSYGKVVAVLGWVWARKDNTELTFDQYAEDNSEQDVMDYLDELLDKWFNHKMKEGEGEEQRKRDPLDSPEETQ